MKRRRDLRRGAANGECNHVNLHLPAINGVYKTVFHSNSIPRGSDGGRHVQYQRAAVK